MRSPQDVNGQRAIVDLVRGQFPKARKEVIAATGPPGCGMTWALERAALEWKAAGGAALHARGEGFATQRTLFPWLTMILPGAKQLARLEVLKGGFAQGAKSVPTAGGVTSYLVDELLNHRKKQLAREAVLLNEKEQDLLFVIQTITRDKRLLIAADHLDHWDDASWSLLGVMLSGKLDSLYPSLGNALFLVAAGREVSPGLHSMICGLPLLEADIRLLSREQIPLAASTFNLPFLDGHDLDVLFNITNGRLDLLHDLGVHLSKDPHPDLPSDLNKVYGEMIGERLRAFGSDRATITDYLSTAAVLGETFSIPELRCLTAGSAEALSLCLRRAVEENLVNTVGTVVRFQSTMLHHYFYQAQAAKHPSYHAKFAECLNAMRPGEYELRVHHLKLAGKREEALVCYALAALLAVRQNLTGPDPSDLTELGGWEDVSSFLSRMKLAREKYDRGCFKEALEILDSIETFLPEALIAERDCLHAQILLKSQFIVDFEAACALLEHWTQLREREPELWSRIAQTLLVAKVQTGDIEGGRKIEGDLTNYFWRQRDIDPWALYGLNVLRRRAECLHHIPTATARLQDALTFFGSGAPGLPRHPIQYYYTLTNLVGNLLAGGQFEEAHSRGAELQELVSGHALYPWPTLEIASNNLVLAAFLSGKIDASTLSNLLGQILHAAIEMGDRILMQNNYAVSLIKVARIQDAKTLLQSAYHQLNSKSESDEYHRYFVGNNLAALLAIEGDVGSASRIWDESGKGMDGYYPAVRETLKRRHELITEALIRAPKMSVEQFDRCLFESHPPQFGPQWKFYGRGFLFTDVQFWAAD